MSSRRWLFGVAGIGLVAFSCGGAEFGGADQGDPDAGASAMADGGEPVGTGGSSVTPNGGRSGSPSSGGNGDDVAGMPGVVGGGEAGADGTGVTDPNDCSDMVAPELPGDCQKLVCMSGNLTSQPDSNDTPEPRGPCDVPQCDNGQPVFDSDPAQCAINQTCSDGHCTCAGCPNGKVPALSNTLCRMPAGVVANANKTLTGSPANRVVDGSADTTWNSGASDGTLTLTLTSPQPMTAIALWLTGSADNNVSADAKYIQVHANVETESGPAVGKNGNFSFAQTSTGPLRLELGLVSAKKITLTFESPSTWIAVHEVIFEVCQ